MDHLLPERWLDKLPMPWLATLAAALVAIVVVLFIRWIGLVVLRRISKPFLLAQQLLHNAEQPSLWLMPLLALQSVWTSADDDLLLIKSVRHVNGLLVTAAVIWLALRFVRAVAHTIALRNPLEVEDNLNARRIQTQVRVLVRCLNVLVILFGSGLILMSFPAVQQIGTSLLASAGLAGLAAGFAAKPVLGNLIAGLQIAIS